jgi:hypothetical protein
MRNSIDMIIRSSLPAFVDYVLSSLLHVIVDCGIDPRGRAGKIDGPREQIAQAFRDGVVLESRRLRASRPVHRGRSLPD